MKKFLFLTLILLSQPLAEAVDVGEIQDVRLARAQLAMADGKTSEALRLVGKNISSKNLHMESFMFLADYHLKRGDVPKAFRVYYYLIKQLHPTNILKLKYDDRFLDRIADFPPPSRKALEIYFLVAKKYFELYEDGFYKKDFNFQVLMLSKKYFDFCAFYRFEMPNTQMYLAQIDTKRDQYQNAIERFIEAKELFASEENPDKKKIDKTNLMLGEALVRDGFSDAGSLYLKSLFLDKNASSSLRQYANAYLDALGTTYSSVSFSHTSKFNDNIHDLNKDEMSNFDRDSKSTLKEKEGITHARNINVFFSKRYHKHWSAIGLFNFLDEVAQSRDLRSRDVRSLSLGTDIKYDNLIKSLAKLKYNYSVLWLRDSNEGKLAKSSYTHSLEPQYIHTLKRGTITYGAPVAYTFSTSGETTRTFGGSVAYSPFWHTRFLSPIYELELSTAEEEGGSPNSFKSLLSLSNHSSLNESNSLFLTLDTTFNSNSETSLDYREVFFSGTYTYLFQFLSGLTFNLGYIYKNKSQQNGENIVSNEYQAGLSYTF